MMMIRSEFHNNYLISIIVFYYFKMHCTSKYIVPMLEVTHINLH